MSGLFLLVFYGDRILRRSHRPIRIASRRSRLARAQALAVGRALGALHPQIEVEYFWIESEGDQKTNISLADTGGKGLFTKAVERALLTEEADIAVHSLKDMPVGLTPGLSLAAIPKRGDVRDCFISDKANSIEELPMGATVGTASPRRVAQLLHLRPDLKTELLRGNIQTRLARVLEHHALDATLLAVCGLQRAGLGTYADKPIAIETILPSASQGALGIQCRTDDHVSVSRTLLLNHTPTSLAVHAERQIIARLEGNCHSPIAVLAQPLDAEGRHFQIEAKVFSPDGKITLAALAKAEGKHLAKAAQKVLDDLLAQGATDLLATGGSASMTEVSSLS